MNFLDLQFFLESAEKFFYGPEAYISYAPSYRFGGVKSVCPAPYKQQGSYPLSHGFVRCTLF
jgi:hypothetical protein